MDDEKLPLSVTELVKVRKFYFHMMIMHGQISEQCVLTVSVQYLSKHFLQYTRVAIRFNYQTALIEMSFLHLLWSRAVL